MKKICYYPELVNYTESITAALMMSQLEFWFKAREGRSFYKFLEPCEHERYKEGDSWQEELGMSGSEIRSAFKKIGMPYKSKKAFNEAGDIFKGKYYASYYDRIRKVTYYFRNTSKVKAIFNDLDRIGRGSECLECLQNESQMEIVQISDERYSLVEVGRINNERHSHNESYNQNEGHSQNERHSQNEGHKHNERYSQSESYNKNEVSQVSDNTSFIEIEDLASTVCEKSIDEVVEAKDAYLPNLKDASCIAPNQQDGLCIQDINQDFIYDKQLRQKEEESIEQVEMHIPYLEILKGYNEELGAYLGAKEMLSTSEKESIKYLWFKLDKGLEDFKLGFKKVAESSFLCGRLEGKHFKASLAWLLKVEHFKRILAGNYDDYISTKYTKGASGSMQKIAQFNQMTSHEDWDFDEIERLERAYIDHKLAHDQQQRALKEAEKNQLQDGGEAYKVLSREVGEGKWANIEI